MGIAVANRKCPMEIEKGMVVTEIAMHGDDIVYSCEMDETGGISICEMNNPYVKAVMKEALIMGLRFNTDSETQDFIELIKDTESTIVCKMTGTSSGCEMSIPVRYTELK